jgi:hypothetical protein
VVLAVVTTGPGQQYWSDAAGITGGVAVAATGPASLRPFDQVASTLRSRFVLTFPRPSTLPATVRVSMSVAGRPSRSPRWCRRYGRRPRRRRARHQGARRGGGRSARWCSSRWSAHVLAARGRAAGRCRQRGRAGGAQTGAAARGQTQTCHAPPRRVDDPSTAQPAVLAGEHRAADTAARDRAPPTAPRRPHRRDRTAAVAPAVSLPPPGSARSAPRGAADARADPAGRAAAEAAERAGVGRRVGDPAGGQPAGSPTLPRRRPGEAAAQRRNGAAGVDDATVEMARPGRPDARQHPAADARAYTRLYDETDRVAGAVAQGRMEFRHAVAKIALAAPGRLDLLDRVIETERRLAGVQMGASAPSEVTLKLLTTARRVVSGEVALVGPTGERVEQASSMLRLIHPDRTTREYRSATSWPGTSTSTPSRSTRRAPDAQTPNSCRSGYCASPSAWSW